MKNALIVFLLAVGCAALNKPKRLPAQESPEVIKVFLHPIRVEVLKPHIKYSQTIGLDKPVGRVHKFFELLVNDKTILDGKTFKFSEDSPDMIRSKIMEGFDVKIVAYKPTVLQSLQWKYSVAYHDDWTIYLNTKNLGMSECSIVNTLAHESTHAWGYSHGDDSPVGKKETFPYWIGDKAEELCMKGTI